MIAVAVARCSAASEEREALAGLVRPPVELSFEAAPGLPQGGLLARGLLATPCSALAGRSSAVGWWSGAPGTLEVQQWAGPQAWLASAEARACPRLASALRRTRSLRCLVRCGAVASPSSGKAVALMLLISLSVRSLLSLRLPALHCLAVKGPGPSMSSSSVESQLLLWLGDLLGLDLGLGAGASRASAATQLGACSILSFFFFTSFRFQTGSPVDSR